MGPQLSANLWHIDTAPNQPSTNRLLQISVPKVEFISVGPFVPQIPALAA